uniref:CSON013647 protein n=1 Tax=Culicoides sonorensis TaxID=179676 RepID=A0A336LL56_CULSO
MAHDNMSFCERIISEINQVFLKDRDLSSFEIIPAETNQNNKSPVIHLEHNLGLESWCIKYVYEYSHKAVLKIKSNIVHSKQYYNCEDFIKYLNVAILINPDVATFWNLRRLLVEKNQLNQIREFNFSALVLSKKPKSNEAFAYRRWLYLFQISFSGAESIDWNIELGLCERCADKNASNYHAWSHRQWVLNKAEDLLKFEMFITEKYIRKHVHDYSCYHHRQFVLRKLYELNYYEPDEIQYKEITDLINVISKSLTPVTNRDELLALLLPSLSGLDMNETKLRCFLYCINYAASDIKFTEELRYMFGESPAFESHRRSMLKLMVDIIKLANSTNTMLIDCWQPFSKLIKVENTQNTFLLALRNLEAARNPEHRRWCKVFIG